MRRSNRQSHTPTFVSGGAPGLGKRSSRWFDPRNLRDPDAPEDDETDDIVDELDDSTVDPIDMIEALLNNEDCLNPVELEWVKQIDRTVAEFDGETELTPRQRAVISRIFARFEKRQAT